MTIFVISRYENDGDNDTNQGTVGYVTDENFAKRYCDKKNAEQEEIRVKYDDYSSKFTKWFNENEHRFVRNIIPQAVYKKIRPIKPYPDLSKVPEERRIIVRENVDKYNKDIVKQNAEVQAFIDANIKAMQTEDGIRNYNRKIEEEFYNANGPKPCYPSEETYGYVEVEEIAQ